MVGLSLTFIGLTPQSLYHFLSHARLSLHFFASIFNLHLLNQEYVFGHHELYGTCCLRRSE